MEGSFEQTLQDGKLYRQVNSLIVAHLRDHNLTQASFSLQAFDYLTSGSPHFRLCLSSLAASAAASASRTPLNVDVPPNKLMELVAKGLAVEKEEMLRGSPASALYEFGSSVPSTFGSTQPSRASAIDFSIAVSYVGLVEKHPTAFLCFFFFFLFPPYSTVQDTKGSSKNFPKHETRHLSEHKDNSITVSVKDYRFTPIRANYLLASVSFPLFIKVVYSLTWGNASGTDHPIEPTCICQIRFSAFFLQMFQKIGNSGAINQYSATGSMYVTASKDGAVQFMGWALVRNVFAPLLVHTVQRRQPVQNLQRDERYVLSCGKDSTVKLWTWGRERLSKICLELLIMQLSAVFNDNEEFVLSIDEPSNEVVIWDALTAERVARWPSNHIGPPRWLEHSPTESAFISCGTDKSIRFWKETL
ncbi:Cleavage stimulation factor subunit 50, partial [Cucurbita argyrosperma subsp. argyrosperma]